MNTSGWPGTERSGVHRHPSRAIEFDAEHRPSDDAWTPAAHSTVPASTRSPPTCTAPVSMAVTGAPLDHLHAQAARVTRLADVRSDSGKVVQNRRARLHQQDARGCGIDVVELLLQRLPRDLRERAGQLHAGRAAADDDEGQQRPLAVAIGLALGPLERQQHAPANLQGIVEGLEPGRARLPVVVAEVRVGDARRRRSGRRSRRHRRRRDASRFASGSMRSTVASSTRRFSWPRRIQRIGDAMSPGDSPAVAT